MLAGIVRDTKGRRVEVYGRKPNTCEMILAELCKRQHANDVKGFGRICEWFAREFGELFQKSVKYMTGYKGVSRASETAHVFHCPKGYSLIPPPSRFFNGFHCLTHDASEG
jgi:hypothetical protein